MERNKLAYFTAIENQGGVVVRETPKFDLDLYIQNYKGRTRWERLYHIGRTSVPLCVDALKAAVQEAKSGSDVMRYKYAVDSLRQVAPDEPEALLDQDWIDTKNKEIRNTTEHLQAELQGYKNNLIKESIRMGHEDLGKHYEAIGDLETAMDSYWKMRPDVSSADQLADIGKLLIRIAIERHDWKTVSNHLSKHVNAANDSDPKAKALRTYSKIANGIASLGQERYREAAFSFVWASADVPPSVYDKIASPNDVAIYGGLLALATMDRNELQTNLLDNDSFREFLQREPHIRRAITQFVNGRYAACIEILESYRPDYLLDIYLQKHVHKLYADIRTKSIVQYLKPFSCVRLETMQKAFNGPGPSIEDELFMMIREGKLNARIDSINKSILPISVDSRQKMQSATLERFGNYEKQALDRIRRMNIIAADLEVKGTGKTAAMNPIQGGMAVDDSAAVA
ncbi:26S proteasome subunit RPN7-domain-containing protein [Sordaria brevicollis]|uniref:COP9 signalosome complex subunit 1 n=1 Tax=Sordaria brevicollis TaxID=83679 RepID=A0AAE0P1V4_SORBR|nr:26S proteasome subunit RPN7-domain-containing protein [Sordaria brevicollis]